MTIVKCDNAPDLYSFRTDRDDFLAPKNAGLLADLSGSEIIRAWTDRLRPDIKKLVTTEDGKIVGLAEFVILFPMYWRQDAWDVAGLTKEDVPVSYTELLDFLEKWMARIEKKPETSICVADMRYTGKNRYARWLLDILRYAPIHITEQSGTLHIPASVDRNPHQPSFFTTIPAIRIHRPVSFQKRFLHCVLRQRRIAQIHIAHAKQRSLILIYQTAYLLIQDAVRAHDNFHPLLTSLAL